MARAGLEPGTAGLQVRRADHSATLPPKGKCKYDESTTKQSILVNTMYIILKEAFETCWSSFEEKKLCYNQQGKT